jgi:hypothetical protein
MGTQSTGQKQSLLAGPSRPTSLVFVQVGTGRSGSTFQTQLLSSIARLTFSNATKIGQSGLQNITEVQQLVGSDTPWIFKTHKDHPILREMHRKRQIHVFSSGNVASYSHYNQRLSNLLGCPHRDIPGCVLSQCWGTGRGRRWRFWGIVEAWRVFGALAAALSQEGPRHRGGPLARTFQKKPRARTGPVHRPKTG